MSIPGKIDHRLKMMEKFATSYNDSATSDIDLIIKGEKVHAHRFVLAAISRNFEKLLCGPAFWEARNHEFHLDVPLEGFKLLHKFMYTGKIDLRKSAVSDVVDLLDLSQMFDLPYLKEPIETYLASLDSTETICEAMEEATILDR